jgi:hypothetical protein
MLCSSLEVTIEKRRNPIRMLNVSTATKKDIRKSTAGQKEVERKAKDPGRSQKMKNPRKKQPALP